MRWTAFALILLTLFSGCVHATATVRCHDVTKTPEMEVTLSL